MCVFWDLATRSRYLTRRQAGGTRECGNGYNRWWALVLLDHGTVVCETLLVLLDITSDGTLVLVLLDHWRHQPASVSRRGETFP